MNEGCITYLDTWRICNVMEVMEDRLQAPEVFTLLNSEVIMMCLDLYLECDKPAFHNGKSALCSLQSLCTVITILSRSTDFSQH